MQVPFVPHSFREPHTRFCTWLVVLLQFFLYPYGLFVEEGFYYGKQIPDTAFLFQSGDVLCLSLPEQVKHLLFFFGQGSRGFEVRISFHAGLALDFHPRGDSRIVDISPRTQVIVGHPFPEGELMLQKNRMCVEHLRDFFCLIFARGRGIGADYDSRIVFLGSERHDDTASPFHLSFQFFRNGIGELTHDGQGYYDIDVFLHEWSV